MATGHDAYGGVLVAFDLTGHAIISGEFDNTVDFGTATPLTAPGQPSMYGSAVPLIPDNIFIVKLAP